MFETALAVHPGYAEALNNLGIIFGEQGDFPQAFAHFEQALRVASDSVQRNPDFEATYLTLARLYLQAGRPASAVQTLQDLLARHPNHLEAQAILRDLGVR